MTATTYNITLSDFVKKMASLGGDVEEAVIRGLQSAALKLDGFVAHEITHASPHPAVDRGELLSSRQTSITPTGAVFAINAPHAAAMENGTRPFRPPFQPIYEWLVRKQLVDESEASARAWMICNAIARVGIAPRHYLSKAFARFSAGKYAGREIGRELEELAQERGKDRPTSTVRRGAGLRKKRGGT